MISPNAKRCHFTCKPMSQVSLQDQQGVKWVFFAVKGFTLNITSNFCLGTSVSLRQPEFTLTCSIPREALRARHKPLIQVTKHTHSFNHEDHLFIKLSPQLACHEVKLTK